MWRAFRGGEDDEYSGPGDADAEAAAALAGRWGTVIWQASLAAEEESVLVAAVIIVLDDAHERLPLLAFAVTDPVCQRRGIGRWLIEDSMRRLDGIGVKELHLAVTRGNPAMALYQRLGFTVIPSGQPGRDDTEREGTQPELGPGPGMARSVSGCVPPPSRAPEDHFKTASQK